MPNAFFQVPYPENEPVLGYGPGSPEREAQLAALTSDFCTSLHACPHVPDCKELVTQSAMAWKINA